MEKIRIKETKEKSKNSNIILEELYENLNKNNIKLIKNGIKKTEELIKKIKIMIKIWEIKFDNKENHNKIISLLNLIEEKNKNYKDLKNLEENKIEVILEELDFVNSVLKNELNSVIKNFDFILIIKDFYDLP